MLLVFCLLKRIIFSEDNEIPWSQLKSLKSDNPNVNATIWNKLDEKNLSFTRKKKERLGKYATFMYANMQPTCNFHICHSAFQKVLCSKRIISLHMSAYVGFHMPRLQKSCKEAGPSFHNFLKHVESRWPTLASLFLEIFEQVDGLKQYVFFDVSGKQNILSEIHFFAVVADIFN